MREVTPEVELSIALFGITLSLFSGLIDQGAADRQKLRDFVQSLVTDAKTRKQEDKRSQLLEKVVEYFDKADPKPVTLQ